MTHKGLNYLLRKLGDYLKFLDIHKAKRLELYNSIPICEEVRILRILEEKDSDKWQEIQNMFEKVSY